MSKEQDKKTLRMWLSGWRVFLVLFIVAFFIAGFGMDLEEVKNNNLLGMAGWHFFSVIAGFGIGIMANEKNNEK